MSFDVRPKASNQAELVVAQITLERLCARLLSNVDQLVSVQILQGFERFRADVAHVRLQDAVADHVSLKAGDDFVRAATVVANVAARFAPMPASRSRGLAVDRLVSSQTRPVREGFRAHETKQGFEAPVVVVFLRMFRQREQAREQLLTNAALVSNVRLHMKIKLLFVVQYFITLLTLESDFFIYFLLLFLFFFLFLLLFNNSCYFLPESVHPKWRWSRCRDALRKSSRQYNGVRINFRCTCFQRAFHSDYMSPYLWPFLEIKQVQKVI